MMPSSLVVDWASVHSEMSNILSVLVISARSLILLTGGSFLVYHPPYSVHSTQPGRAFLTASPMMLLLFPKLPSGSHLRVGVKVHMVVHKAPHPLGLWSQLLLHGPFCFGHSGLLGVPQICLGCSPLRPHPPPMCPHLISST